jgi:hypothetical protein
MTDTSLTVAGLLPADLHLDPAELTIPPGSPAAGSGFTAFVGAKLGEAVTGALGLDVLELIAQAWAKADELRGLAKTPPGTGELTHVFLAKHEVACENKLNVVLEFAGAPAVTDHLRLTVTAQFEGVGLTIDSGCIVALDAGRGAAKAELHYSNAKLVGSTTDWVTLPGKLVLSRPIPIVAAQETPAPALRAVAA